MSNEEVVEKAIRSKGLSSPRLDPKAIDETILSEQYHVFPGTNMTVCCLTLRNGYNVVGESSCASDENFDLEIGQMIARENARKKIWALEGYLLKENLFRNFRKTVLW